MDVISFFDKNLQNLKVCRSQKNIYGALNEIRFVNKVLLTELSEQQILTLKKLFFVS